MPTNKQPKPPFPGKWGGYSILTPDELESERIALELALKSDDPEVYRKAQQTIERNTRLATTLQSILPVSEERLERIQARLDAEGSV